MTDFIPIANIEVGPRQREDVDDKSLSELVNDIKDIGLLHPIVLAKNEAGTYKLIAGERRLKACASIHDMGSLLRFSDLLVPVGEIPYTLFDSIDSDEWFRAELSENVYRRDLTWREKAKAMASLHKSNLRANPSQTITQTASEVAAVQGKNPTYVQNHISRSLLIDEHIDDPDVASANSERQAWEIARRKTQTLFKAKLQLIAPNTFERHILINGDMFEEVPKIPADSIHCIITDPPYGIDANSTQKIGDRFTSTHKYDDTNPNALKICEFIFTEGYRVSHSRANLFMFIQIANFTHLHDFASSVGWTVWPHPIIWQKGREGIAPWGSQGFIRTYETLLFATKGGMGLLAPICDVIYEPNIRRKEHAAEKPSRLYDRLMAVGCNTASVVLDPCCGSGGIFAAANTRKCKAIGIELNTEYYTLALSRMSDTVDIDITSDITSDTTSNGEET